MKPITTHDFMGRIEKIVEEVSARACVDKIDTEVMEAILEECYIAINAIQHRAYDEGHSDGYSLGYDDGYLDGQSAV